MKPKPKKKEQHGLSRIYKDIRLSINSVRHGCLGIEESRALNVTIDEAGKQKVGWEISIVVPKKAVVKPQVKRCVAQHGNIRLLC